MVTLMQLCILVLTSTLTFVDDEIKLENVPVTDAADPGDAGDAAGGADAAADAADTAADAPGDAEAVNDTDAAGAADADDPDNAMIGGNANDTANHEDDCR